MLKGEAAAMAAYVARGERIPRRGALCFHCKYQAVQKSNKVLIVYGLLGCLLIIFRFR